MSKRAVIMAGGKGTRLHPYTLAVPKPLMPVGDIPILDIVLRQLASHGFDHVTLAVNHQADIIEDYCRDGSRWNIKVDYSLEDRPLSTIGPLRLIKDLPEHFLIMNGDTLTDFDYGAFYDAHCKANNIFTVSYSTRESRLDYGVLQIADGQLKGFLEKPVTQHHVCMGINMASRRILELIPANQPYGFDHLMHDLLARQSPASVYGFEGYWLDIGRPNDYKRAMAEFEENKERFLPQTTSVVSAA